MNREERFDSLSISQIRVKSLWTSIEITTGDVSDVQLLVSGSETMARETSVTLEGGKLLIEQPLQTRFTHENWLEVLIRLPKDWRGAVDLSTATAPIRLKGISGTDIILDTVAGSIRCENIRAIAGEIHTVTGRIDGKALDCDKLNLRTISGSIACEQVTIRRGSLQTVSGDGNLAFTAPFEALDVQTVSGNVFMTAPRMVVNTTSRAITGHTNVFGMEEGENAAQLTHYSLSGSLDLNIMDEVKNQ